MNNMEQVNSLWDKTSVCIKRVKKSKYSKILKTKKKKGPISHLHKASTIQMFLKLFYVKCCSNVLYTYMYIISSSTLLFHLMNDSKRGITLVFLILTGT